jgi:hypothetical protein
MKKSKILASIPQILYSICGQNMEQFEQILLMMLNPF